MSKLVLKLRDQNRRKMVKKFAGKRAELMALINDQKLSPEDRYEARLKLQKLPRNSSPVRLRNRCHHRASARRLPQVRPRPHEAARNRHAR